MSKARDFIDIMLLQAIPVQIKTGIPAAVMIAQAAQETGWGEVVRGNNLFNIKGTGTAGHITLGQALEYDDQGNAYYVDSNFCAYHTFEESFADYAELISTAPRYAAAMAVKEDPEAFIRAVHAAGYATDPSYSDNIISIMRYNDLVALVEANLSIYNGGVVIMEQWMIDMGVQAVDELNKKELLAEPEKWKQKLIAGEPIPSWLFWVIMNRLADYTNRKIQALRDDIAQE